MYRSSIVKQYGRRRASSTPEVETGEREKTVWVLDQEWRTREAIKELLSPSGYSVRLFDHPESLFDRGMEYPCCLIVDYTLAGFYLNGVTGETSSHNPTSVIFLSHVLDLTSVVKAIRGGGFEFLLKPIEAERLLAAVHSATDHAQKLWHATSRNRELKKKYESLTKREREVLPYVVSGFLNKQTAFELGASEVTIRIHRGQIMRKMGAPTLADLVKSAARIGIVDI